MDPRPSPSPKIGKMPISVADLAFDFCVLYYRSSYTLQFPLPQTNKSNRITSHCWELPTPIPMSDLLVACWSVQGGTRRSSPRCNNRRRGAPASASACTASRLRERASCKKKSALFIAKTEESVDFIFLYQKYVQDITFRDLLVM